MNKVIIIPGSYCDSLMGFSIDPFILQVTDKILHRCRGE